MASLADNDAAHPYKIEITGLNAGNLSQVQSILSDSANSSKYVDLSPTELPSGISSLENAFKNCKALVKPPVIPAGVTSMRMTFSSSGITSAPVVPGAVTDMFSCFQTCRNLGGTITINTTVVDVSANGWLVCFRECSADKIDRIRVPDATVKAAVQAKIDDAALKAKVVAPGDAGY